MILDPRAWARLGRALLAARQARDLTQQQVADLAGVSSRSVADAEAGTVPKSRMPYTIPKIAAALAWPEGAVEAILDGREWREVSAQRYIDENVIAGIATQAMVRVIDGATAVEIREATQIILDELRKNGVLVETDFVQPETKDPNP
ncbi:helix-turn-helix transcriptional regulator [Streptomyces sp. NPDC059783]|uniref:helix-turn-helix transcriptional regulator n=1 Tax=Streptomyces sp. NPDC059783 TaxID=3346944 RepID=UPI00366A493D